MSGWDQGVGTKAQSAAVTTPPPADLRTERIQTRDIDPRLFPFDAFSFSDPNATASPVLTLASPWRLQGQTAYVDTATNIAAANPVLAKGQIGFESDTLLFKLGDGTTAYNSLTYQAQRTKEVTYTPALTGFGAATSINFTWTRIGNRIKVMGKFTCGTTTGVEARIALPGSSISDAALVTSIQVCGVLVHSTVSASSAYCLIESGVGYVTIGFQTAGSGSLTKINGTTFANSEVISVGFELPVSGWNG